MDKSNGYPPIQVNTSVGAAIDHMEVAHAQLVARVSHLERNVARIQWATVAIAMVLVVWCLAGCRPEPPRPVSSLPLPPVPTASPSAPARAATRSTRPPGEPRAAYVTARALVAGRASWYGPGFHGRRTASGARFNQYGFTAASRSLPFGTRLIVTNPATGRAVVVVVNDRGPFVYDRTLDLSAAAFAAIAPAGQGVCRVRVEVVR